MNFRNYKELSLDFNGKKNVIVGDNAQGKTNLVEAICYLASLTSPRTSNDSELVYWKENNALVEAFVEKANGFTVELDVIINPGKSKILKLNKLKKSTFKDYLGHLAVVSFSIDDLLLLRGTPKDRRKWIDSAISQLYPVYYDKLSVYNKVRQQKQAFLKSLYANSTNMRSIQTAMIESWNEQLALAGSNIVYLRKKFLKEIYPYAKTAVDNISGGKETLKIKYDNTLDMEYYCHGDELKPLDTIRKVFNAQIKAKQDEEISKSQVIVGPHRDDIKFFLEDKDATQFASQGQQRTVVLALKLAELELVKESLQDEPLLILDDVLAELDLTRQKYLFKSISSAGQTIITTTDVDSLDLQWLDDVDIYKVQEGMISHG